MSLRALVAIAALATVAAPAAFAADMPAPPPPSVIYAQPDDECGAGTRQVDHVWKPGQVAYIVAQACGSPIDWINHIGRHPRRENVLVYYNGGTWYRPDIRVINTPYQPQLHR
ncbi:MAG: hypothetical protein WDM94_15525 [Bauldia sp.]